MDRKQYHYLKAKNRKESKQAGGLFQRVVINFGAAKIGSMNHIKGSMKGPHQKLLDALMKMPNVLVILEDEYLTSQVCSSCWELKYTLRN